MIFRAMMILFTLALCLAAPFSHGADKSTSFGSIQSIRGIIPQKTQYYSINNKVDIQGPYYVFTVSCAHEADYSVTSIDELSKALHEISVIEWFRSTPQGDQVWRGVKDSVKGIGKGAKQLVLHPGDSGMALGRNIARMGRSVGGFLKGLVKKNPKSSSGKNLDSSAGNFLTQDTARQAAYELHLDAYSANPYVRQLLESIAAKRAVGSLGVSAATFFVPGASTLQTIASGALTPGAYVDATEKMIRDNPAKELMRELKRQFMVSFGKDKNSPEVLVFDLFLKNPNYNPRQKAYMTLYLEQTAEMKNMNDVLQVIGKASTEEEAKFLYNQMQLISACHMFGRRFASFAVVGNRISGQLGRGDIIALWPYDYADNTKLMQEELKKVPQSKQTRNIWLIGDATPAFDALAKKHGISSVQTGILHYPAFSAKARGVGVGAETP